MNTFKTNTFKTNTLTITNLKIFILACCGLFAWLAAPAAAAQLPIILDGVNISLEPAPGAPLTYAQERLAQERDGAAFIPLRSVSELLGAAVAYYPPAGSSPAQIRVSAVSPPCDLLLTLGSRQAILNGQTRQLPAAPFSQNGAAYVPLRLVAESLGCTVYYHDGLVSVATEPFAIEGAAVASLELADPWHVLGSDYYQIPGGQLQRGIYNALLSIQGEEAAAPQTVCRSWQAAGSDYYWGESFAFSAGDGSPLYKVSLVRSAAAPSPFNAVLLYDHQTNRFHTVAPELWRQAQPIIQRNSLFKIFSYSDAP